MLAGIPPAFQFAMRGWVKRCAGSLPLAALYPKIVFADRLGLTRGAQAGKRDDIVLSLQERCGKREANSGFGAGADFQSTPTQNLLAIYAPQACVVTAMAGFLKREMDSHGSCV